MATRFPVVRWIWQRLPGPWRRQALDLYHVADRPSYRVRRLLAPLLPAFDPVLPLLDRAAFVPRRIVLANSSLAWGGAERQVVNTLLGLGGAGLESIALLCLRLDESPEHGFYRDRLRGIAGLEVATARGRLAPAGVPEAVLARLPRIRLYLARFPGGIGRPAWRFVLEFLARRPEVVHAWQDQCAVTAGLAALIVGVPAIVIGGRNLNPSRFGYYRSAMPEIYRLLLRSPRARFVNNSAAGAADYARWLGAPTERFGVLRNGVDETAIRRAGPAETAAYRRRLGIPPRVPVVGGVFRLSPEKDPMLWVETMARMAAVRPEAHFLLIGAGPLHRAIRAAAERLAIAGRLHMPGEAADVALSLSAMDVLVLASQNEGTPNVLIEAGLLGLPVVATDAGGTRETFDPGRTGWLVESRDAAALAGRVLQILADREWAARAATLAPAFIRERFGMARMIEETLGVYGLSPA